MLTQMYRREWGISSPGIIVTLDAVETRQVIEDARLPGRGIVVHHKVNRAFATIHQTDNNTILVHPEIEQQIRDTLSASINRDIDAMILRGFNG